MDCPFVMDMLDLIQSDDCASTRHLVRNKRYVQQSSSCPHGGSIDCRNIREKHVRNVGSALAGAAFVCLRFLSISIWQSN